MKLETFPGYIKRKAGHNAIKTKKCRKNPLQTARQQKEEMN